MSRPICSRKAFTKVTFLNSSLKTCPGGAMWVTRPMRTVEGSKTFLFPHLTFLLDMNGDQIVAAKVSTDVSIGEAVLLVFGDTAAW